MRTSILIGVLGFAHLLAAFSPADARECKAGSAGPLTLVEGEHLEVCVTNLNGLTARRIGIAFYDAFDARHPLDLTFLALDAGRGGCTTTPRLARVGATIIAQVGFLDDGGPAPVASAQVLAGPNGPVKAGKTFLIFVSGPLPPPDGGGGV
jgi:hypothetical protein